MSMFSSAKSLARELAGRPAIARLLWQLRRGHQVVLMLHRFSRPGAPWVGHDLGELRALLAYLRECEVTMDTADALVSRTLEEPGTPSWRRPSVAFTVDDGYADAADLAHEVFAEFDCPFTLFVVPEAVDQKLVFWWDQLAWLIRHGKTKSLRVEVVDKVHEVSWGDVSSAFSAQKQIEELLKRLAPVKMADVLADLSRQADVPLLDKAPSEYTVLCWDRLRVLESRGVTVGAHSMTHPILSACDDVRGVWETQQSVARVNAEMTKPSRLFCYPNGRKGDFGERESAVLSKLGLIGALSSEPGPMIAPQDAVEREHWRWRLPRVSYDSRPGTLLRSFFAD